MANQYIKRAFAESEYSYAEVLELEKCTNDPIYFIEKYVKVQHPTMGPVPFILYDYQRQMIDVIHNNKDTIILCSRQLGKTTVVAIYLLWLTTFFENKLAIIASKANSHAIEIMARIKFAYEEMPHWLKAGCKYYNRHSIEFDNGSIIKSEATTEKTGRGSSPSILFLDEIAFISHKIQEALWASLTPSLSTGGKFILTSTPNGDSDLYATLWREANAGINGFKPFKALYYEHPERGPDSNYYEEMRGKLGEIKTRQELDCEFLSSDALLINSIKLLELHSKPPIYEELGFKYWKNIGGKGNTYLMSVDIATGNGNDFSVIEVFEFPSLEQVVEWRSNVLNIPMLYQAIKYMLNLLTKTDKNGFRADVFWTFERNGVGEAIKALLFNDEQQNEYAELVNDKPDEMGMNTSGKSKILACLHLKQLIEKKKDGLQIHSDKIIFELQNFIASGGSYAAKKGATDDTISALLLISRILKQICMYDKRAIEIMYDYSTAFGEEEQTDAPMPFLVM
ncbi:MAG: terminase family protein [Candidatus Nitrosotenuis sp.]